MDESMIEYAGRVYSSSPDRPSNRLTISSTHFWRERDFAGGKKNSYVDYPWSPDTHGWKDITLDVIFLEDYDQEMDQQR